MATLNLNEKKIPSAENLRLIAQLCISLANKQSSLEDRCIAPWKSGEVYQKDISYVSYNDYLYFCTVSNSDTDFVESHWTKLSDTISELTKADIEALVNLTPEQITNLQSLIDDTSISTTHTNSSSHIYMAIQDAIAECKDDTLKQIAKKVSGSYKIANTTADIISADYIYLLSNGTNYDLYVLVDGTATKVGDTNIDLSEYVKTTDLADYMKTTDADGKFATITTVDGKVDKSEIPTTLPANGGNADTVNNHTVKSDVPENAKFTDTVYDDTELNAKLDGKADTDKVAKKIYIKDTSSEDARTLIQNHWSEFDRFEFYNLHIDTAKWAWDAEIYAHTQEYGTVLLRSYGSDVPSVFYGKLYNSVWTWQELATMDKVANSIIRESKSVLYNLNNVDNIEVAIDIAKSGYKPIAVSLFNSGIHLWFAQGMYFNDTVCNLSLRGVTPTSATNAECKVLVTYIKTS